MSLKKSTGLTGLAVAKAPRYTLEVLYGKILRILNKMPDEAAYKKYTQEIISHRLCIIKDNEDTEEIEKKIGCGQIEEVIVQAENELSLARKFVEAKPWEPLVSQPPKDQWKWPPV